MPVPKKQASFLMPFKIIVFLRAFLFATSFGCALSFSQPNILLIVSDDHGKDAGCYGNKIIKTPGIDALAADGILYKNAYSTVSSCSPSRSVILSGMYNHANGMYGLEHEHHHFQSFNSVKALPVMLKELGYRTGRVGKFHVAPEAVYKFDEVMSAGAANDMASLARSPIEMAEKIDKFISNDNSKPFFLYCAYDDPHRAFPFETYPEPNSFGNRAQGYPGITEIKYEPQKVIVPSFLPDNLQVRKELAQYYQSVSRMDQGISKVIQILKSKGLYEILLPSPYCFSYIF
jgi:N-sulfoglucosamine sulfohydrolase